MGDVLPFRKRSIKTENLAASISEDFRIIQKHAKQYLTLCGPDPLIEVFINLIDKRETIKEEYLFGSSIVNNIDLGVKAAKGTMVFEQFCVPCAPIAISSDMHPMDLGEFKRKVLAGLSPKQFIKDYRYSEYYPIIEGVFFLDNPDYLYLGTQVGKRSVIFTGLQLSTMKTVKIRFDLFQLSMLENYVPTR